jgi:CRP-like cAMP-binding protein
MSQTHLIAALAALPCLRKVPTQAVAALASVCPVREFQTRDTVLVQGTDTDVAYLLIDGMLEVSVQTQRTCHHITAIQPGEIVGESALFIAGVNRNATVLAHKPSRCLELRSESLSRLSGNPAIVALEMSLVAALSRRIRKTNLEIQSAWKETHPEESRQDASAGDEPRTFAGRLRTMFAGRGGQE